MKYLLLIAAIWAVPTTLQAEPAQQNQAALSRPDIVPAKGRERCKGCGTPLTDDGRCPVCQPKSSHSAETVNAPEYCWSWFEREPVSDALIIVRSCNGLRP